MLRTVMQTKTVRRNFGPLVARLGAYINDTSPAGQKRVAEVGTKILIDIMYKLIQLGTRLPVDADGQFRNVLVECGGEIITVRGCINDGIIKLGTTFIQP